MAITRRQDRSGLAPRWFWPTIWTDDDLWTEDTDLEVYETDDDVVVKANVAGVPAEDVDVSLEGGVLTIQAEHQESEEEKKKKKTVYRQGRQLRYYYTTTVPMAQVQPQDVAAEVDNGILTVTMPKKEETKPRQIKVRAQPKKK